MLEEPQGGQCFGGGFSGSPAPSALVPRPEADFLAHSFAPWRLAAGGWRPPRGFPRGCKREKSSLFLRA